jgi:pimeloyl-ACP methyl ester carboxylesterase
MFRNLIPALADRYHLIPPDYPGFGQSDMPDRAQFAYTSITSPNWLAACSINSASRVMRCT